MKESNLRLAIIGAGMISRGSHLPAALGSPRATVTAIVDPYVDRAAGLAREFGISVHAAADVREVIDDFDAAIIATPNATHASIAIECISNGKHVLIDKPLATTVAEGREIVAAGQEAGVVVAAGYSTRFRNNVWLLKEILDRHEFGDVRSFVNRFGTPGGWSPVSAYNLSKKAAGGGVLVVSGTHFLDRMLYFWGMPDDASMLTDTKGGAEANCHCTFEYDNGLKGGALYSKTAALPAGTVIDAEAGYLLLGEFDSSDIVFRPHDSPELQMTIEAKGEARYPLGANSFDLQMDDFVDACLAGRPPLIDGDAAVESLVLIERLYSSAQPLVENWFVQGVST